LRARTHARPPPTPTMLAFLSAVTSTCPDLTSSTVQLDLNEFIRASWYVQEQQVAPYQPLDSLYCVAATYDEEGASVPFYWGNVISVYNHNNNGRVNGPPNFTPPDRVTPLCARDEDAANGKLKVAPCFLPNFLTGPYWVIALESAADGTYTGAAVIGGNPSVELSDGCTTPEDSSGSLVGGGTGLWIFAREPIASPALVAAVKAKVKALGVATSRLNPVAQANCTYDGYFIKPRDSASPPPPMPPPSPPDADSIGWGWGWGWLWSWTGGWTWGWGWSLGWH